MATRKQRRRKHEQATQHGRRQRERLRAALSESLDSPGRLAEEMDKRGYQRDWVNVGKWRAK